MQNANKIIYSLKINIELQKRGFVPIISMPNPNNPKLMCWVYERTNSFTAALDEIIGGCGK